MPRTSSTSSVQSPQRRRGPRSNGSSDLVHTAEVMVGRIEDLVAEIATLRADNDELRSELRDAVSMLERANAALGGAAGGRRRAGAVPDVTPGRGRKRAAHKARRGRATPAEVTPEVVRAVIGKLGSATSAEIATEIGRAGNFTVNGRAIRWIAERAGARIEEVDGQRRYRL